MRVKAFSTEGVKKNLLLVEADRVEGLEVTRGMIRVWDSVAGSFTSCHSLSQRAINRIRQTHQAD
jgi:hypothetical protein